MNGIVALWPKRILPGGMVGSPQRCLQMLILKRINDRYVHHATEHVLYGHPSGARVQAGVEGDEGAAGQRSGDFANPKSLHHHAAETERRGEGSKVKDACW